MVLTAKSPHNVPAGAATAPVGKLGLQLPNASMASVNCASATFAVGVYSGYSGEVFGNPFESTVEWRSQFAVPVAHRLLVASVARIPLLSALTNTGACAETSA